MLVQLHCRPHSLHKIGCSVPVSRSGIAGTNVRSSTRSSSFSDLTRQTWRVTHRTSSGRALEISSTRAGPLACAPEGRLLAHETAALLDEFQRELIVEITSVDMEAANKRGRRGGRPRAMDERILKHAEAMLKETENCPYVGDVIDQIEFGHTAFVRHFPARPHQAARKRAR